MGTSSPHTRDAGVSTAAVPVPDAIAGSMSHEGHGRWRNLPELPLAGRVRGALHGCSAAQPQAAKRQAVKLRRFLIAAMNDTITVLSRLGQPGTWKWFECCDMPTTATATLVVAP